MQSPAMIELALDIAGRNYKLRVPAQQQAGLEEAAVLLNQQIAAMKERSRQLNAEQAAVLAALNLSYDLLTEREMLAQEREALQQKLQQLQRLAESCGLDN
jgi:cell division protein ZapA